MRALDAVRGPDAAAVRVQDALPVLAAVPAQGETVVRELAAVVSEGQEQDELRVSDAVPARGAAAVLEHDVFRVQEQVETAARVLASSLAQGVAQGPVRPLAWSLALAVALGLVLLQVRDAAAAVRKLAALLA